MSREIFPPCLAPTLNIVSSKLSSAVIPYSDTAGCSASIVLARPAFSKAAAISVTFVTPFLAPQVSKPIIYSCALAIPSGVDSNLLLGSSLESISPVS